MVALVSLIPLRPSLAFARFAGWVFYHLDGLHYRIARQNLDQAYGDELTGGEKDRIIRGACQNLAMNFFETLHAYKHARKGSPVPFVELAGKEHLDRARAEGKGIIICTGHLGNWEMVPVGLKIGGLEGTSPVAPLRNPRLNLYLKRVREVLGHEILMKRGAFRTLHRRLRDGNAIGILVDQNRRRSAVFVDFFGRKAATVGSVALLALRTGSPILIVYDRRMPGKPRHVVRCLEPMLPVRTADTDADVRRVTQEFTLKLEEAIRERPEQWLWQHRRWRTRPPEEEG
jgi:KDO2-lipid IV(A) lauroyltransferase